ncbi:MAG TPA: amino acid adenylation domain-containing protein, partial [Pyrinomonadaceae bacterium]
ALNRHPKVRDSVVVLAKDKGGNDVMVAYYVARQAVPGSELREFLAESVYEETIPSMWMHLRRLPLTLNGKVNHAALPGLEEVRAQNRQRYVAPRTLEERALAGIWADVLGVEQVGLEDNFFELGGHSLLATQVISRVRSAFGVDVPLRSLFEARTVALLGEVVARAAGERDAAPPIPRAERTEAPPLSFAQQRLWFMDQLEPGGSAYNVPTALGLKGALDAGALARSLEAVVARHESLRTTFGLAADGQPVQVIADNMSVPVPLEDLRGLPEDVREDEARRLARAEAERPFDLTRGPLLRARLLRLSDEEHVLLVTMHHIVSDGWSMGVFVREVAALYDSFVRGVPAGLPELPIQYADFAVWQRQHLTGETLARQLDYWRQQLGARVAPLELPADRPRPAAPTFRGAQLNFSFDPELARALGELSRREGATPFMVLLAAFKALLHRYTGQEVISIGTPIANRTRAELEGLVGFFVNTLVLRTSVSGGQSFRELLGRVRETALGAYAHQDIAFEKLVEELQPERSLSHTPLFQVMFIFQNTPSEALALPGLDVRPLDAYGGTVKYDLVLNMREDEAGLHGTLEYATDLFDAATVERLLGHFENVLRGVAADEQQRVARLPLLGDDERRRLLEDSGLVDDYRRGRRLHELFEAQAARDPEATAVTFRGERLSYGRLDEMGNQVARGLAGLGAGPGRRVAVMLADGPLQVAALLGVLKAGCAFVCLDSHHPTPRLRQVLDEVEPACLLTDEACAAGHAGLFVESGRALRPVLLDAGSAHGALLEAAHAVDGAAWFAHESTASPAVEVGAGELAYVVYTSGSTGRPKGIMQTHESFCQFVDCFGKQFGLGAGERVAQWASVSYDAAYAEIFGALCNGATLCMTTQATKADPRAVYEWARDEEVTLLQSVPSFCRQLLLVVEDEVAAGVREPLPRLRAMLVAGEVLRPELARAWLSRFGGRARLYNLYGPTESVLATCHHVAQLKADEHSVPVGRALAGRQILVLDGEGEPSPVGVPGEIYVRSPYLAAGYFGDDAETARRFRPDPLEPGGACRLYHTGDLGSWRADGTLRFHGRVDHQVKVRGVRVELADVEAALAGHARVRECAVVLQDYGDGDARLVAHVLAQPGAEAAELREHLRAALPDYMMPAAFVLHERLPRTASGKIDRRALPAPDAGPASEPGADFVAPRTELEREVAEVWQAVLRVERVGVEDNFFHLGGHSLLATQMINQLRQRYEVNLPLRGFIEAPTVASLAGNIAALRSVRHDDLGQLERLLAQVQALSEDEVRAQLVQQPPATILTAAGRAPADSPRPEDHDGPNP